MDFYKTLEGSYAEIYFLFICFQNLTFDLLSQFRFATWKAATPITVLASHADLKLRIDSTPVALPPPPHQNQRLLSQLGFPILTWTWALTLRQLRYRIIDPSRSSDSPHTVRVQTPLTLWASHTDVKVSIDSTIGAMQPNRNDNLSRSEISPYENQRRSHTLPWPT